MWIKMKAQNRKSEWKSSKTFVRILGETKILTQMLEEFPGRQGASAPILARFPGRALGMAGQDAALRQGASVRLYKVKEILARWREREKSTETRCKPRWISRTNGRTTCHEKSRHSHSIRGFLPFQDFRCHGLWKWRSLLYAKMQAKTPIKMFS